MSSYSIIFKQEAEEDLIEIYNYYETKSGGLGARFLDEFEGSLTKVKERPYHTFNVGNNFRRIVTKTFPFSIYYLVVENTVVIFAVLHQSRNPSAIFNRLR